MRFMIPPIACLWEIFKASLVRFHQNASVTLRSLPAKTNMSIVGVSLCSRSFARAGRARQHCVNEPQPTQSLPLDSALLGSGNTHVSPLFLFVCGQRVLHNSAPERSIIPPAPRVSHPAENSPQSYSLS